MNAFRGMITGFAALPVPVLASSLATSMRLAAVGLLAGVVTLGLASAASANLLINGSFESGSYTFGGDDAVDLPVGSTAITGWTVVTNNVAPSELGNPYLFVAEDGTRSLDLQSYNDAAPYGGVSQVVSTIPGVEYDLSFWVGIQNSVWSSVGPASVRVAAGPASQTFTNTLTGAGNQWEQFNLCFTASAQTTTIDLSGASTAGGYYIGLDNVSLQGPGDVNGDGLVDVADYNIWAANVGETGATWSQGDLNGDGLVDVADYNIWAANVGKTSGTPEPVTLSLLALGGLTMLGRRKQPSRVGAFEIRHISNPKRQGSK